MQGLIVCDMCVRVMLQWVSETLYDLRSGAKTHLQFSCGFYYWSPTHQNPWLFLINNLNVTYVEKTLKRAALFWCLTKCKSTCCLLDKTWICPFSSQNPNPLLLHDSSRWHVTLVLVQIMNDTCFYYCLMWIVVVLRFEARSQQMCTNEFFISSGHF
jgi:hypothetical protein